MKKWLWITAIVIAGAYFAKPIMRLLSKAPIIGSFFAAKSNSDLTPN